MNKDIKIKITVNKETGAISAVNGDFTKLNNNILIATNSTNKFHDKLQKMITAGAGVYALKQAFDVVTASVTSLVKVASTFETQQSILLTLEGSGKKAQESFKWIQDFAAKTPYELEEVTNAFLKAKAYGIDPTNGTLKTLGDTASGMGKSITDAVEAMADAMTGENERLKEFGVKGSAIGDKIGYSWTDSSGKAKHIIIENNTEIIQSTLSAIFNSKYENAMQQQMNTWKGLTSNLSDNYTNFLNTVATNSGLFDAMKFTVGDLNSEFQKLMTNDKDMALIGDAVKGSMVGAAVAVDFFAGVTIGTFKGFAQINTIIDQIGNNATLVFRKMGAVWSETVYEIVKSGNASVPNFLKDSLGFSDDNLNDAKSKVDNANKLINDSKTILADRLAEYDKYAAGLDLIRTNISSTVDKFESYTKVIKDNTSAKDENSNKKKDFGNDGALKNIAKQQQEVDKLNKALLDISQIGMSEYDKGLISITEKTNEWKKAGVSQNDILIAQSKLLDELKSKTLYEAQKEDLSYYERKIQLMDDSIGKETELQGIAYTNKILEIENSTKSIAEKDKLIAKETELFNLTVQHMTYKDNLEFQNTMSNFYDDMLDSQLALNNAVYDFGSGFDGVSSKIGAVSKSIAAMSSLELTNKKEASKLDKKYIEQFNKYAGDVEKTKELEKQYTKDTAILNEQNIQAQLAGYSNIAGAMSGMFEQGSREAASFQLVESGLALATGIRAILTQGSGDPYTSFARMAAMTATVSSMLGNIGVAFGMNKTTTSSDSFSATSANTGTGSVLGDASKQSESITNALSTLQDFAKPEYQTLLSMNNYLETIANNIGGVTSLLIQSGGFAFGDGYTGFDTGYKNNINWGKADGGGALLLQPINSIISKIPVIGQINNMMGSIMNAVLGGVFGKTKVYQSLTDSGIYFADTLLTSAIEQFNGQAYQTISTTVEKKSWFSKSSSTSISTYFDALDSETERQFSLVLDNLYNTVLVAGTALDSATVDTANLLANFTVSLGKISLLGKTGDQIQEALTSIFGKVGDDIAKMAFPLLSGFQKVGEGMFETLTRVATGMEEAEFYIGRLGNKFTDVIYTSITNQQGDVGFEALLQSIEKFDEATYGANNNLVKIIDSLDSTAEELYTVYTVLDELRDKLIFLGQSSAGISSSMIYGAGGVDSLSGGFNSYFENFLTESEQLAFKTSQLSESFTNLGIQMPTTNTAFKTLLSGLDLTSESGQELYGRLITLSDSFAEISSLRVSALQDELDITNTSISNIQEISTSLDSVITSLRSGLDSSSTNLLDKFNRSMATSLLLSNADDYTALANSVKESINYSSALNNSDYFGSLRDMQFAQSVAANNFENININLEDELSVLQKIANNTNEMIDALSNLTSAVKTLNESSSATASNTAVSRIA